MKLSRRHYHDLYYFLRLNRRVNEQLAALYRQGKVVGGRRRGRIEFPPAARGRRAAGLEPLSYRVIDS